ncbi:hypothetical protein [Paenirhodobacter sp.]|uniref:hypothetical protein n=1 Tax=Paenirhodobacter sp. TaxID=1965326 RepID=UPI003B5144D3
MIETKEKYWLAWREEPPDYRDGVDSRDKRYLADPPGMSPLDSAILRLCVPSVCPPQKS